MLPTAAHSFPRVHSSGPQEGPASRLPVQRRAEQEAICHTGLNDRNNKRRRGICVLFSKSSLEGETAREKYK